MISDIKVCLIISYSGGAALEQSQWRELFQETRDSGTLSQAIIEVARASHQRINLGRYSTGAGFENKQVNGDFEIARDNVDDLLIILNAEASTRGITGNNRTKFENVVLGELQDAATRLGYPQSQINWLSVSILNGDKNPLYTHEDIFFRANADYSASLILDANPSIWENS